MLCACEACQIYHIVHATEDPVASVPVTQHARVVLGLMSRKILFTRKASSCRLWAVAMAAEEGLCMPLIVLPEIAAAGENCS